MTRTIDMSPTWEAAASIYALALESGTDTGRLTARRAVSDMGVLLDRLAAHDPELFTELRKGLEI